MRNDSSSRRFSTRIASGFGTIFVVAGFALAAILGIMAQVGIIGAYRRGDADLPTAILIFAFSLILTVIGLGYFYFRYHVVAKRDAWSARQAERNPEAPWLLNEAWAERKVTDHGSLVVAAFLWIWSIGWNGLCAFIYTVNYDKIIAAFHTSWLEASAAVIFPLCGLIGILCAAGATLNWWRYGPSTLHIDTLPGYLGDKFRGHVIARMPSLVPLEAEIICERRLWVRRLRDGKRSQELVTEKVWSSAHPIDAGRLMRTKDGTTTIPIDVPVPAGKPPVDLDDEGGGIQWVLAVRTDHERLPKPAAGAPPPHRFEARFAIPVYARR